MHAEKRESIRQAVRQVLTMDDVRQGDKRSLLDVLLWKWTGIEGKYAIRYQSESVLAGEGPVRHEHVVERKKLIDKLLAEPNKYLEILDSAVGCLVTLEEHKQLSRVDKSLEGWDRYKAAGIAYRDTGAPTA